MSAVNPYKYKRPSQIRGERFLRDNNLLVPAAALSNIEAVKRKARAIRLKEEYQRK
jgi:predicted RNA methylase